MSKQDFLARIRASRALLNEAISGLTEDQMTRDLVTPDWTVKDILAHIAAWQNEAALGVERAARGELIVFTDADCEPTPEFLAALTAQLRDPSVGGSQGVYISKQPALVARFVQLEYESRYRHTTRCGAVDLAETLARLLANEADAETGPLSRRAEAHP